MRPVTPVAASACFNSTVTDAIRISYRTRPPSGLPRHKIMVMACRSPSYQLLRLLRKRRQAPMGPAAIPAPLAALSEDWPEGLRLEITNLNLSNAQVWLPANLIEPALKRGRVTFTWKNLRPLIKPTPPPESLHDGIEVELPLKVIAPLFLTWKKAAPRSQSTALPPANIPNLFFGFPQPQAEAPVKAPAGNTDAESAGESAGAGNADKNAGAGDEPSRP